jgi:hypothetical protein
MLVEREIDSSMPMLKFTFGRPAAQMMSWLMGRRGKSLQQPIIMPVEIQLAGVARASWYVAATAVAASGAATTQAIVSGMLIWRTTILAIFWGSARGRWGTNDE